MKYDVDYFIDKFQAIPEASWGIESVDDGDGHKCALGHLGCGDNSYKDDLNEEGKALVDMFVSHFGKLSYTISEGKEIEIEGNDIIAIVPVVNDNTRTKYNISPLLKGNGPKQRILNVLYDIKAEQEAVEQVNEIIKHPLKLELV